MIQHSVLQFIIIAKIHNTANIISCHKSTALVQKKQETVVYLTKQSTIK